MTENTNSRNFIKDKKIEIITISYFLAFLLVGLLMQSLGELGQGLINIFKSPGQLITDYMVLGGIGPSLVNAALVGLIGCLVLILNKVPFRGASVAAVFTMFAFGMFGKNVWSVCPILFGVFLYGKISGSKMVTNIYPALFGTALAPLVTQAAFGFGWGVLGGIIIGIIAGLLLSPIASHVLKFHEGYNLYNVGYTAGFVGFLIINILRAFNYESEIVLIWGQDFNGFLRIFVIITFLSMILLGFLIGRNRLKDFKKILSHPGTLVTDFTNIGGFGNTLINMGGVGLIGVIYIELIGGDYNGASLAGLFTMVGFGAFGKHILNVVPIMFGVWLASIFSVYEPTSPGPLLAALFGTALAPIAGKFGPIIGVLAGGVHLFIVSKIGFLHGGLNLYNNGFAAGFVAALFIAIINGFKKEK